jgi:hypothetical protein
VARRFHVPLEVLREDDGRIAGAALVVRVASREALTFGQRVKPLAQRGAEDHQPQGPEEQHAPGGSSHGST